MLDVLDDLREKCPWDKKQTFESLRPNTIEETYELCDALAKNDMNNVCNELGDVLMHTAFYALLASEKGENGEQVLKNWEQLKRQEKDGNETVLSGVPDALPSVIKAYRIQDKARNVGFDWKEKNDVWAKVREELDELETELKREDKEKSTQELGDFLFSVINAARLYHLNPDNALEKTNQKFIRRFNYVEQHSIKEGKPLTEMTLEEMDELWNKAKNEEREMSS